MNEVFGEENFVGNFLWRRRQRADSRNQSNVSTDHEYVIAYSKSEKATQKGLISIQRNMKIPIMIFAGLGLALTSRD